MKIKQPDLKNFPIYEHLNLFSGEMIISQKGIFHTKKVNCPTCNNKCVYNGQSNKGKHILDKTTTILFRKGQQYCSNCKKTIQVENKWLDEYLVNLNDYVITQIISLSKTMSENDIKNHLSNTMSIEISKSSIHKIIKESNIILQNYNPQVTINDDFYGYDEQYLKINGKTAYRLVFYDHKMNNIIYEKIHYKFSKKILIGVLKEVFKDNSPKGFVVDMKSEYPNAFKEVFGKKIKIQYCIFHLNKLILKEYRDSQKIGKIVKWNLVDQYNLYTLFNIFYDRTFELKKIKKFMFCLEDFKLKLNDKKLEFYCNKYSIKVKDKKLRENKIIEIIEKKLLKAFRKITHNKRNNRKKTKKTLKVRTVESAREMFDKIYLEKEIYPKKIIKRIEKIKTNFEYFIASQGRITTNNKLEGFFGSTLKKFRKKGRKTLLSFSSYLNGIRAIKDGKEIYRKFSIYDISKIFMIFAIM